MSEFAGFPAEALGFYQDIAEHNDQAWFKDHRSEFMDHVIGPCQAFITDLGARLQARRPKIQFDTNHNGRGSFKKIHTDRRFNPDRAPFKTYAQMIFWEGPLKVRKENVCFLVHFDPDKVVLSSGLKYFERDTMKGYRASVLADGHGKRLASVARKMEKGGYSLGDVHFKKVPRGVAPDHPRGGLLRHNALYAYRSFPLPETFHTAGFLDFCEEHFEAMLPMHDWCVKLLKRSH
jgi:uncharacterized protein (TIGR02453 family)